MTSGDDLCTRLKSSVKSRLVDLFRNESVGLGSDSSGSARDSGALTLRPFSPRRQDFF